MSILNICLATIVLLSAIWSAPAAAQFGPSDRIEKKRPLSLTVPGPTPGSPTGSLDSVERVIGHGDPSKPTSVTETSIRVGGWTSDKDGTSPSAMPTVAVEVRVNGIYAGNGTAMWMGVDSPHGQYWFTFTVPEPPQTMAIARGSASFSSTRVPGL
jgi:hypothetical protein